MLKLGNQGVAAMYLGGRKITKAYLGEALVFGASAPPEPVRYTVTLSVDPQGGGTASGGGSVGAGTQVTVTASASSGYTFTGWRENGTIVSTNQSYTFTVTGDRSLTAVFAVVIPTYRVTAGIDPEGSGTASGGGTYQQGASVTVTAAPGDGYRFVKWTENGQTVSESISYTFTVTGNRTLMAVFEVNATSRLPAGYTEVEWIQNGESTNNNYIPFIYNLPAHTGAKKFQIKFESLHPGTYNSYSGLNCVYARNLSTTSQTNVYFVGFYNYTIAFQRGSNNSRTKTVDSKNGGIFDVTIDSVAKTVTVNGQTFDTGSTNAFYASKGCGIFYPGNGSTGISQTGCYPVYKTRIYTVKMWDEAGVLLFELVPCISPSGILGFYDTVGEIFYKNMNTNTNSANKFLAGPAV